MKRMKRVKLLVATLAAASIGCFAWGAAVLPQKDVALASSELAVAVASEADYFVYGGSVRVTDEKYGPGVKYHVAMTAAEFDKYGTIGEKMGTLDSGYTTGTLLLPTSFLGEKDLVRGGSYGVTLSDSDTSKVWKKTTIGGKDYMESVIYLYNIPETDYGTDMSLRGYIYNENEDSIVYTEQVNGMSMSFVAKAECGNANTELTEDELNTLKTTYVDKTITYHIGDATETATVEYLKTATKKVVDSRQDDNDEFVGWYTKQGNEFNFSTPIKNNVHVYAHYRESIVLSSLDSTQAIKNFRADTYKRAATDTISSMVLNLGGNEYNLGNNPDAVDVTGFESNLEQHGEGTVTVTYQRADSSSYTLELPALVVTEAIYTAERFVEIFTYPTQNTTYYGYYTLGNDIGDTSWLFNANARGSASNEYKTYGFCGTFDGNDYTITGVASNGGLFNWIGRGAVIKNVNILDCGTVSGQSRSIFGLTIAEATLENIHVTVCTTTGIKAPTTNQYVNGLLASYWSYGSTFKNVTVDAGLNEIYALFGSSWYGGYEHTSTNKTPVTGENEYENVVVNAGALSYIGYWYEGSTAWNALGTFHGITEEDGFTFNKLEKNLGTIELETSTDIVLGGSTARNDLDLGEYADWTVNSVSDGFAYADGKLTVPETIANDKKKHGEYTVTIGLTNDIGQTATLLVPIIVVTEEICTAERFVEIFTYPTAQDYYGYYRLADDIGDQSWNFNASGRGSANCEWRSYGFRGTFDGNDHTITGVAAQGGLFGWIGTGALIKNVNILDYGTVSGSHRSTLALTISMATLENINVTVCTTAGIKAPTGNRQANGLLASQWCYGTTLKDVTVDAGLNEVYALFGSGYYSGYEHYSTDSTPTTSENTYENVVVNAGALSYIGYWYDSTSERWGTFHGVTEEDGFTFNKVEKNLGTIELETSTDIVLGGSTARNDLDLGEYADWTVNSVSDGFAYADGKLTVPETIANDKQKHGEYTVTFGVTNDLGQTATLLVPIIVVTQEIMTTAEFTATMNYNNTDKVLYGYYTLGADIGSANLGGGQPWQFAATGSGDIVNSTTGAVILTAEQVGRRGNAQPEYYGYGFRGTFDGRDKTVIGRAGAGGLFGLIGLDAVIKNVTLHDVYFNGTQASYSLLASFARGGVVENVTFKYEPTWASVSPTNPAANQYNVGWIVSACCDGMTFTDCTVEATGYDIYALFGSGWYAGYEHRSTSTSPVKTENTYNNFQINVNSLGYLGYWYEGSTAWNALGTFHGVTVQDEVSDNDGQNDIIYVNGERVSSRLDENPEFAAQTVILNGANKNVTTSGGAAVAAMDLGDYAPYVTAMSWKNDDGNEVALTYNKESKTYTIPSEYLSGEGLAMHGDGEFLMDVTYYAQEFTFSIPVKVVTLEITTAAQLATFLRNYASVANDEEFNGYTAAGQSSSGLTFRWEGTNIYDGYFTLGADIDYSNHTNTDKRFNVYQHCYNPYDEGTRIVNGAYWYPMDIELAPGNEEKGFRGVFDGQGHTITGFSVYNYKSGTGKSTSGLISKLTAEGVIRNVGFVNASSYLGAIVSSWGHGTIENIYVKYSSNIIVNTFNTHNYVVGIDGASELNAVGEQLAYIKDSIIDVSALSTADTYGAYLGYTKNDYTNIENVIFYGGIADGAGIAYYPDSLSSSQGVYNIPFGSDSFTHYTDVGELLRNHKTAINGWNGAFEAKSDGVYFNGTKILSGTEAAAPQTNYLVNTAKTGSDYVLVYDENNATVSKMATYLIDQVRRASGTVDYYEATNSSSVVITQGIFEELVTGGVTLKKMSNVAWSESARYIVLGDWDLAKSAGVSIPEGYDYTIQWEGNSLFILASSDDGYNPAVNRFLEEAIGFRGLSDSYTSYDDVAGKELTELIDWTMNGNITFHSRSQTGFNNSLKREIKAINGYGFFTKAGPVQENGTIRSTHNSMYWLPNNTTMYPISTTGESTLPAGYATNEDYWYSTHTRDHGTYTAYDLCYTARGTKGSSDGVYTANDSSAYDQMVYWTAQHMLSVLEKLDPAKDAEKEILTFGCMDDVTVYYACTCSGCSSKTGGAATPLIVDFLNRVLGLVLAEREDVILYMLGYYYLEDPEGVTVEYPDNFGVIYAPISRPTTAQGGTEAVETKSIYDAANDEVRARIADWASKVKHMAFWFYDTLYSNFMMPMDTYRSMLTWMEYAARTCQDKNVNVGWFTVNGQSSVYNPTGFADFKTYLVQKAEIEILEKVTVSGSDEQITAYLTELENEFFGRNPDGSFNDKGYYGPAAANQAMYNFYKQMCTDYQNKVGTIQGRVVDDAYTNVTYYYTSKPLIGSTTTKSSTVTFAAWLAGVSAPSGSWGTTNTLTGTYHMTNWTKDQINVYMNYLETAMTAVKALDNDDQNPLYAARDVFERHVLQESLFPRFVVCMGNYYWSNGYDHSGKSNWNTTIANARAQFKTDFASLGNDRYSEHSYMSAVYSAWGI